MDALIEFILDLIISIVMEIPFISGSMLVLGLGVVLYENWPLTHGQISAIVYGSCATVFCGAGLWLFSNRRRERHRTLDGPQND